MWYHSFNATNASSQAVTSQLVLEAARLAKIASPSEPPIMKDVFTTPDASPESSFFTSDMAARSMGLNVMPAQNQSNTMLGSTSR